VHKVRLQIDAAQQIAGFSDDGVAYDCCARRAKLANSMNSDVSHQPMYLLQMLLTTTIAPSVASMMVLLAIRPFRQAMESPSAHGPSGGG
jgi:hypothetical protein